VTLHSSICPGRGREARRAAVRMQRSTLRAGAVLTGGAGFFHGPDQVCAAGNSACGPCGAWVRLPAGPPHHQALVGACPGRRVIRPSRGMAPVAERRVHGPEVAGSTPAPAIDITRALGGQSDPQLSQRQAPGAFRAAGASPAARTNGRGCISPAGGCTLRLTGRKRHSHERGCSTERRGRTVDRAGVTAGRDRHFSHARRLDRRRLVALKVPGSGSPPAPRIHIVFPNLRDPRRAAAAVSRRAPTPGGWVLRHGRRGCAVRLSAEAGATAGRDRQLRCGVEQLVARRAHNPEVAGSSPAPATIAACAASPGNPDRRQGIPVGPFRPRGLSIPCRATKTRASEEHGVRSPGRLSFQVVR
jgi:hypothetical protein